MATQAYYTWRNAGSPFRVAKPIERMVAYARALSIAVLGTIGNDDHLTASFPEDHTPFSYTAWPTPLPGYVVCACDLANTHGLGAAILRDARAGRLGWLKYMNVAGQNYAYADGFRQGRANADQHIHLSCFSNETWTDITGYDPIRGDATEMDATERNALLTMATQVDRATEGAWPYALNVNAKAAAEGVAVLLTAAAADEARDKATAAAIAALADIIKAGGGSVDVVPILARINEVAAAESRAVAELQGQVADLRTRLAEAAQAEADKLAS